MKKILSIILLLAACSVVAHAQDEEEEDPIRQYVSWGLRGSVGMATWISDVSPLVSEGLMNESVYPRPRPGGSVGIFVDYHISQRWSLVPTLTTGIENIGLHFGAEQGTPHNSMLTTWSMDIALPIGFRIPLERGALLLNAGPYSRFVVASHNSNGVADPYKIDWTDEEGMTHWAMAAFHSGVLIGIGYEMPSHWLVQMEYSQGFTDLLNLRSDGAYIYPSQVSLTVGYHFH